MSVEQFAVYMAIMGLMCLISFVGGMACGFNGPQPQPCDSCCAEIGMTHDRVNALCEHLGVPDDEETEAT